MRVLGIDPGTAIVGYSIVDFEAGKYNVQDYGCIYTDKEEDMPARLERIYDGLDTLIKLWNPSEMAIEDLFFFKNQKTIVKVGQARGVITLVGQKNGLNIFSYTPLQVKIGIAGYGRAEKNQVQQMVKMILKLEEIPKPDDAADALAIAVTHINSRNSFGGYTRGDNIKKELKNLNSNKINLEDYKKLIKK